MPMAIPLIAAVVEVGAGYAAVTAVGATVLTEVAGGLMIAGGALSAVGTVTGNKTLTQVGAIVGAVGGVTDLADVAMASSTASGGAAGAVGTTGADYGDATAGVDESADAGAAASDADAAAAAPSTASGFGGAGTDAAATGPQGIVNSGVTPAATSDTMVPGAGPVSPPGAAAQAPQPVKPLVDPSATSSGSAAASSSGPSAATGQTYSPVDNFGAAGKLTGSAPSADTATGWADKLADMQTWAKNNPLLAYGAMGLVQGGMNAASAYNQQKQQFALNQDALVAQQQRNSQSLMGLQIPTYTPPPKG